MSALHSFDLSGRIVMVTGASSGLGRHFAQLLAANGARVVITARRLPLLEQLKAEIEAKGGAALPVAMDIGDEQSIIDGFDLAEQAFGPVDSVVANAGINIGGTALGMPTEDFDRIVSINLRGAFLTAREGARRMIAAGSAARHHGRVLLISSITANHVYPHLAPYSATKAALGQLCRTLALEWSTKGVTVNSLCPGYMRTELNDAYWSTDRGRTLIDSFPRKRLMDVDALDPMLLFLCSDLSGQVTGSEFTIDDGQTLG